MYRLNGLQSEIFISDIMILYHKRISGTIYKLYIYRVQYLASLPIDISGTIYYSIIVRREHRAADDTGGEPRNGIRVSGSRRQRESRSSRQRFTKIKQEVHTMSNIEIQSKVNDLRELRRMAEELQGEIDAITERRPELAVKMRIRFFRIR